MRSREHGLDRLGGLKEINNETEKDMEALADRFDGLKGKKPIVASSFNLFPTPPEIADRMVEWAQIGTYQSILEPSAGTGRLIEAMLRKDKIGFNRVQAVEIDRRLSDFLEAHRWNLSVHCGDFLDMGKTFGSPIQYETFDRVIMNPPFKNGCDRHHVDHALKFLKPGGVLVTLMANGPRQREWYNRILHSGLYPNVCWRNLPAGSFKCEGTNVDVGMIQITR